MQISRFTLHTACLLLLMRALAGTQSGGRYDLMWSTVDGGGAVSADGDYALDRTAGQPDAGTLSGSGFELSGLLDYQGRNSYGGAGHCPGYTAPGNNRHCSGDTARGVCGFAPDVTPAQ
jgi:hypothetical protein